MICVREEFDKNLIMNQFQRVISIGYGDMRLDS